MSSNRQRLAVIGAGFLGKSLIRNLLMKGHEVSVLARNICPDEFVGKVDWNVGNFHDQSVLSRVLQGASIAYHLVSSTVPGDEHVDVAMELQENVVGSLHFIDTCIAASVLNKFLLFIVFCIESILFLPIFCFGLMAYLIIGAGNPLLLSSTAITLHVIAVYILLFPLNIGVYPAINNKSQICAE